MVIREVMRRWEAGEKSLLFCFRVPTAETLNRLLRDEVDKRLKKARTTLLQSRTRSADKIGDQEKALQEFRQSLTSRTRSVIPLFLDRVLLGWAALQKLPLLALEQQHSGAVELVTGATKSRPPIFNAFNTPLLPDILICTQVGQEGIDLHRQCRHVVHYDLGWNPATLEQRTGRVDRIGSKAFRERKIRENTLEKEEKQPREDMLPGLEIAIPYLAGTYDERIFDCLRSRAQIFDILTGGDPFLQGDGASPWLNPDAEGIEADVNYVPLPETMLGDLRVNLAVPVSSTGT